VLWKKNGSREPHHANQILKGDEGGGGKGRGVWEREARSEKGREGEMRESLVTVKKLKPRAGCWKEDTGHFF